MKGGRLGDIYYQGVWRMDWGLGNPNKTAALIALLMLAVWTLPLLRRWLFWVALPAFAALGVCLMHTMSRGGVVAAAAGFAVLSVCLRRVRPWPRGRTLAMAVALLVIIASAHVFKTSMRFARSPGDHSVSNRLEVWGQAPRMIADAPWGWGHGSSGRVYMGWYQPLDNTENYRTLVNSHLTWLVEWGWPMRLLYAFGWAVAFTLCCGSRRRAVNEELSDGCVRREATERGVMLFCWVTGGIWTAFFVAAVFSSVAEAPALWVVPLLGLAGVLALRTRFGLWPSRRAWTRGAAGAVLCLGVLAVCGYASERPAGVSRLAVLRNGAVCVGERPPRTWVVVDPVADDSETVSEVYPRACRERRTYPPVGFVSAPAALPSDLSGCSLAVIGAIKDWKTLAVRSETCESLLLIAPDIFPEEFRLTQEVPTRVVFGEFSNRPSVAAWQATGLTQMLEGVGDFFQNWPDIVFGTQN
ncbi:MAG: O-antigen ligase family protein [Kiritimatiellae bacterium]|nr:O-antigen ligase family protein [Kiritimatiellia bacterium]